MSKLNVEKFTDEELQIMMETFKSAYAHDVLEHKENKDMVRLWSKICGEIIMEQKLRGI